MTGWTMPSAAATLTVVAMLSGAPVANVVRVEPTFNQRVDTNAAPNTANPRSSGTTTSWAKLARMISSAVRDARDEGNPVANAAADIAFGVAASLSVPGRLSPSIVDNELGGVVFYWKGVRREIQIEIDADTSHFVRIKGGTGEVTFLTEGFGAIPIDEINRSLQEWSAEQQASSRVSERRTA